MPTSRLSQLASEQYLTDTRRLIADFYRGGNSLGPAGSLQAEGGAAGSGTSSWFAVYRPCSRDSISKMLGQVGVGKGLNIKGKSAKKNKLSGFVPFCQISKNEHKADLENAPSDARTRIFYQSLAAKEKAKGLLASALLELKAEKGSKLEIDKNQLEVLEILKYAEKTNVFGLDVPERLFREVHNTRLGLGLG